MHQRCAAASRREAQRARGEEENLADIARAVVKVGGGSRQPCAQPGDCGFVEENVADLPRLRPGFLTLVRPQPRLRHPQTTWQV